MTRFRRLLPTVAPVVALAAVAACGGPAAEVPPRERTSVSASEWRRLPDPPLSRRTGPVVAWVAGRLVVVGGDEGPPCPPNADCALGPTATADGAAYDAHEGSWHKIADAPRPLRDRQSAVALETRLYVLDTVGLLEYDAVRDRWRALRVPAREVAWLGLAAAGDRVVLYSGSDEQVQQPDLVLDPSTGTWTRLPDDPLGRSFDRQVVDTPAGLVLLGRRLEAGSQPADPALVRAAVLAPGARRWRQLPDSDQLGGGPSSWTGEHLVDATLGGADGGEVNGYGRTIPYGGRLDPAAGTWSRLPDPPDQGDGGWPVQASTGSAHLVASGGWLYDDRQGEWLLLPPPSGGPDTPGPAAWDGDRLFVVGGQEQQPSEWTAEQAYSPHAWVLTGL